VANQVKTIQIVAPAKINLFLDILGRRTDGYHEIKSLILPISLYDRITIEATEREIETVSETAVMFKGIPWPISLGNANDNLTTRAARVLKKETGYAGGARIILEKHVPIAGGLGGGSSDAASVLKGLNTLWHTGISVQELMNLGASLGSDIPAMVHGGVICAEGIGERITPVPKSVGLPVWVLLVNPGFTVSTKDIYSRYIPDLTSISSQSMFDGVLSGLKHGCIESIAENLFNALEKTVFRKYPILEMIKKELEQAGALGVLLSGTGATVFALVRDAEHGQQVQTRLRESLGCPVWTGIFQAID